MSVATLAAEQRRGRGSPTACRVPAISGDRVRRGPGPGRGGARARNAAAPPDPRRDARRSVHRGRRASPVFREPQPRPQPVAVRLHRAVSLGVSTRPRTPADGHRRRRPAECRRQLCGRPSRRPRSGGALAFLSRLPADLALSGVPDRPRRVLGSCGAAGAVEARRPRPETRQSCAPRPGTKRAATCAHRRPGRGRAIGISPCSSSSAARAPPPSSWRRGNASYVATIRTLAQAPLLLIERDQSYAWARSLGFTFLYPYFDRDLVDLSLRIPPDELISGGRHKAPLRRLVAARLPSVAMHAKKVDFIQALHDMLRPAGRSAWRSCGGPVMLAELGLVDVGRLDRLHGRLLRWAPFVLARGLAGAQHRSVAARPLRCVVHVRRSGGCRMTPPDRDQAPRAKGVVAWERPTLTLLGDVKDLIHASGKGSDQGESDPASPRKGRLIG